MANYTVSWRTEALQDLGQRDRYTREAVLSEFPDLISKSETPDSLGVRVVGTTLFATPVAGNRYSVVWGLDKERESIEVLAVSQREVKNKADFDVLVPPRKTLAIR